jgi:hypothetical protein
MSSRRHSWILWEIDSVDEYEAAMAPIETPHLRIALNPHIQVASLRFFDTDGPFANAVQRELRVPLPPPQRASFSPGATPLITLAWRAPSEVLALCDSALVLEQLSSAVADLTDGCLVDLTGGLCILQVAGERVHDLFALLGGQQVCPTLGEARGSRLADVPVFAIQAAPNEFLFAVDRLYGEHFMSFVRAHLSGLGSTDDPS